MDAQLAANGQPLGHASRRQDGADGYVVSALDGSLFEITANGS